MMETMRPKELYKDIKSTDSKMVSKSPKTKGQSCNKGKLNYHKIKQKSKPQSGQKNQDNFEFTSIESCEGKNVNNGQTPSQVTEISSRRMASINKNKTFKEDIINDNKEMFRAISHISFTNQTDMFDNYDSNNSNGNDRNNEEVRVKDIDDDDDENLAIDVEEERINILSNSFLNLTTTKNKFFNKSISSEQECPQNHDENEEITNKSMADVILRIESYNNSSFELKNKSPNNPSRNQLEKENTGSHYFEKDGWVNSFEGTIMKNQASRNEIQFEDRKNTKNEVAEKLTKYEDYSSVVTCMIKCNPMESKVNYKILNRDKMKNDSINESFSGSPSIRQRYISPK